MMLSKYIYTCLLVSTSIFSCKEKRPYGMTNKSITTDFLMTNSLIRMIRNKNIYLDSLSIKFIMNIDFIRGSIGNMSGGVDRNANYLNPIETHIEEARSIYVKSNFKKIANDYFLNIKKQNNLKHKTEILNLIEYKFLSDDFGFMKDLEGGRSYLELSRDLDRVILLLIIYSKTDGAEENCLADSLSL